MAHFAQLDNDNVVTQVIVVHNNELLENGNESEAKGIAFCKSLFGSDTSWAQTSYNNTFRKNYAGIGYKFDNKIDAFIPPQPFPSWVLDKTTATWNAPVAMPSDALTEQNPEGKIYVWDEPTVNWVEYTPPN